MAGRRPQAIDRPIAGDRRQPRRQCSATRIKLFRTVPQGEERLLDDLGGNRAISAWHVIAADEDGTVVSVVEDAESLLGSSDQLAHQARIGRWIDAEPIVPPPGLSKPSSVAIVNPSCVMS